MIYHDYVTILEDYDEELVEDYLESDEEEAKHEI